MHAYLALLAGPDRGSLPGPHVVSVDVSSSTATSDTHAGRRVPVPPRRNAVEDVGPAPAGEQEGREAPRSVATQTAEAFVQGGRPPSASAVYNGGPGFGGAIEVCAGRVYRRRLPLEWSLWAYLL